MRSRCQRPGLADQPFEAGPELRVAHQLQSKQASKQQQQRKQKQKQK